MKKVEFSKEMLARATQRAFKMGDLNNNFSPQSNTVGMLGEEIFQYLFPSALLCDTSDYDFIINSKKIDVKSVITSIEPKPYYEFSITKNREDKDFNFYFICAISSSFSHGWAIGTISKEDFFSKAKIIKKGDQRPNGGVYKADAKSISYAELNTLLHF